MTQPYRTPHGGIVDRDAPLGFTFDGRPYTGFAGDTLASALLANGAHLVSRSLKYRRPRGIYAAGGEEPNALVQLEDGPRTVPNVKATEVPLYDGLVATSQRGWPSPRFDLAAVAGLAAPVLPAGFYYKTFMRPRRLWPVYERLLRSAASSARVPDAPDPDRYDKRHAHADVLVVGAGPAGLAAALAACRSGARVILADDQPVPGGSLLDHEVWLDGTPGPGWAAAVAAELDAAPNASVLQRTSVFGRYPHGRVAAVQQLAAGIGRQRCWHVQAAQVVLATGATERPLVFCDNDRPGVMLASAAQRYVRRFGVAPGRRAVVVTNNDTAYTAAGALAAAGVELVGVVDLRPTPAAAAGAGVRLLSQALPAGVRGRAHVQGLVVERGPRRGVVACDLVCVSGGWTPAIGLYAHGGAVPALDETWGAFVPDPGALPAGLSVAGACAGTQGLDAILREGAAAGRQAAVAAGRQAADEAGRQPANGHRHGDAAPPPRVPDLRPERPMQPVDAARQPHPGGRGKAFVDLQTDVGVGDIEVALREGYTSIEHVKRYTTLGMGTDQGRTGNVNAMGVVAHLRDRPVAEVGTTTSRPPHAPVTLGALAGRESGPRIAPVRRSPIHPWHEANGAVFMPAGLWLRPKYYAGSGGELVEAATREAANVRRNVGIADVSTLGKIDLQGPDVLELLDRVYVNRWTNLAVGRARYGVMLRDDGYVLDDGTTSRLDEHRCLMTTTSGNAEAVLAHLEFFHQQVWPDLEVSMTPVTDQWATVALAGPRSREVLAGLLGGEDVGGEALPFMGVRETHVGGVGARISRISFSGELAYELAVPAGSGLALWEALLELGRPLGIRPYGLEAMDYLRIEKGHLVVGPDIDGRVSPYDLGLGAMCKTERDFVGRRSLQLPVFHDPGRPRLAGLVSTDGQTMITAGAQLVARPFGGDRQPSLGRVTSRAYSVAMDRPVALGLVAGGHDTYDTPVYAVSPVTGGQARVEVVAPRFYDPAGQRMKG